MKNDPFDFEWYNSYTGQRFKFDPRKSMEMKCHPKRGIDFIEVQSLWERRYYEECRNDDPEQFIAIGWLLNFMKKTAKKNKKIEAEKIANMADEGKDVTKFFSGKGQMKGPLGPIHRVNVDFTARMLDELDRVAVELNISRQAVIKTYLRQALDQHYLAKANSR